MIHDAIARRASMVRHVTRAQCGMRLAEELKVSTRSRVFRWRRRPLGISGGSSDEGLPQGLVRAFLATGRLPVLEDGQAWAGPSTGTRCSICNQVIGMKDFEYEVGAAVVHGECFTVWVQESRAFERT